MKKGQRDESQEEKFKIETTKMEVRKDWSCVHRLECLACLEHVCLCNNEKLSSEFGGRWERIGSFWTCMICQTGRAGRCLR